MKPLYWTLIAIIIAGLVLFVSNRTDAGDRWYRTWRKTAVYCYIETENPYHVLEENKVFYANRSTCYGTLGYEVSTTTGAIVDKTNE